MLYLIGFLFLSLPVLLVFSRLKVRFIFSWVWTIFVCSVVFAGIVSYRGQIPSEFLLMSWAGNSIGSPTLLVDLVSWPFAMALVAIGLGMALTSAQRLADSAALAQEEDGSETPIKPDDWQNLTSILALMGFGLLGILAGNPSTLVMAWAGGDLLSLGIALHRVKSREGSERIVLDFSARVGGILLVLWAMVSARISGNSLSFGQIPDEANVFLLIACGLRLGILPLQVYFFQVSSLHRGLGTMLRMAMPAAASLVLLVRVASTGVPESIIGLLLVLTALAGLYAGFNWWIAKNEIEGRSFWVLGMGALAVASAIRGEPRAVESWGLALLLAGTGLFLYSARSRGLNLLMVVSLGMISALPGTPTMNGIGLFSRGVGWVIFPYYGIYALLMAGFLHHVLQAGERGQISVRAVRAAYVLGLMVLPGTFFWTAWGDGISTMPEVWWASPLGVGLASLVWAARRRNLSTGGVSIVRQIFSFHWLYRLLWRGYRLLGSAVVFVTSLLEGEAGILWTLLLLTILFSVITSQVGLGG